MVLTSKIQENLKGIHYPANKNDMLDQAKSNNAPDDVMDILSKLPEQTYYSPTDVNKAVSKVD